MNLYKRISGKYITGCLQELRMSCKQARLNMEHAIYLMELYKNSEMAASFATHLEHAKKYYAGQRQHAKITQEYIASNLKYFPEMCN